MGETGQAIRDRLTLHNSNIHTKKHTAIAMHFNSTKHKQTDLTITPIDCTPTNSQTQRKKLEKLWIKKLKTQYPYGLNNLPM